MSFFLPVNKDCIRHTNVCNSWQSHAIFYLFCGQNYWYDM